ncbi:alpha/beta hydrolase family protein [Phyllobacterium calauticae]|uniref:alpha/beta hydrolase family protein n=1 Tax=Phyllobacterium calauticae TaxID=2817027 RepID=UPI001CBEAC79|nr:dienelactone hydrolase family protein [Phyllobacterium calauticae]MBZ3691276.1 dienelactone hydrolase family protein [Phyllobacterium calauticae]
MNSTGQSFALPRLLLRLIAAILTAELASAGTALAGDSEAVIGGVPVHVWEPDQRTIARQPVIFFSHGFHGCSTQSKFLMRAFAKAGYMVFAPNHHDATCNNGDQNIWDKPQVSLRKPLRWTEATFRNRADDFSKVIAALKRDRQWNSRINWNEMGLAGHSLGGYTVLGMSGAWPGWRIDGVKATLALSPYVGPYLHRDSLRHLEAPVMYQGGTRDIFVTPKVRRPGGGYDLSKGPKYYVEFLGAGHLTWTDLGLFTRTRISEASVAFMDRYVRGKTGDAPLSSLAGRFGVSDFRYEPR